MTIITVNVNLFAHALLYKCDMTLPAVNSLPSIDTLLATLQRGGVVITATQRLARHLIQQVSIRQSDVIEKPAILSIESWLIETWSQIEEVSENPRRMLSTAEASELWRRVIEDHTATERSFSLLQSESAANWRSMSCCTQNPRCLNGLREKSQAFSV